MLNEHIIMAATAAGSATAAYSVTSHVLRLGPVSCAGQTRTARTATGPSHKNLTQSNPLRSDFLAAPMTRALKAMNPDTKISRKRFTVEANTMQSTYVGSQFGKIKCTTIVITHVFRR